MSSMIRALALPTLLLLSCDTGVKPLPADLSARVVDLTPAGLAPCAGATFASDTTTIHFGGDAGLNYNPQCLTVAAGSTVTFTGDFSIHPLSASTRGTSGNPIPVVPTSGQPSGPTSKSVTFAAPGLYPYYCQVHGLDNGGGMAGLVQVQ